MLVRLHEQLLPGAGGAQRDDLEVRAGPRDDVEGLDADRARGAEDGQAERHSAIVVTAYGTAAGTVMLCMCVPVIYGLPPVAHVSMKAWLALAASGVLCTAATSLLWNWGMTQVPASQAGVLLNMEPLIGSLLGVFVLREKLGPSAWVGGGLILAAAFTLTTRSKTRVREQLPVT